MSASNRVDARDTSLAAMDDNRAATLRTHCRKLFADGAKLTADECALKLGESILAVRPRVSELAKKYGFLKDSGERRSNDSGRKAIVWQATT